MKKQLKLPIIAITLSISFFIAMLGYLLLFRDDTTSPARAKVNLPIAKPAQNAIAQALKANQNPVTISAKQDHALQVLRDIEDTDADWQSFTVGPGDSLYSILKDIGLPKSTLAALKKAQHFKQLSQLKPGQTIEFLIDYKEDNDQGELDKLRYSLDKLNYILLKRSEAGHFQSETISLATEVERRYATIEIKNSLYYDGQKQGVSDRLIHQLIDIFGWEIDFARDLRSGDRFSFLYEVFKYEGKKVKTGNIIIADFNHKNKILTAIQYIDPRGNIGYYNKKGISLERAFIRHPVKARISSRFNLKRLHPVLKVRRPHRGVDYAAQRGTPIKATGNGRVKYVGRKGGYGRVIVIQHGPRYTTLYAHLKRYASGIHRGSIVKLGQTIAYVGSSGVSTGPHLHYEFRINGVHRNPITVALPKARPIAKKYRQDFLNKAQTLLSQLEYQTRIEVAQKP
ncbi:peptidase M23 [Piscirickettsia salmonis]|nr:peptidoglycan DD-metalloendopeptidase family protein [Piscirickettsia salmonis]APS43448.1 peptidase M23 [Piscirickettsia salmonis]APS46800.1 peptidase M23 [Piscirickettsia salmonis]APS53978.1 peptidase M23 [Piscirickettsia salmonis]APS57051.1 peptidase M23 [Piscirickettsia salmonis]ERL62795.1 peptidase M23 family protein [Piscirickettsia salmonis LF-89 = ATCC VR-1361]